MIFLKWKDLFRGIHQCPDKGNYYPLNLLLFKKSIIKSAL